MTNKEIAYLFTPNENEPFNRRKQEWNISFRIFQNERDYRLSRLSSEL
jgi:hypothetical protein